MADTVTNACSARPAFTAGREEGQNAYVMGPNDEIVLEITSSGNAPLHQFDFALLIATLLNQDNDNHRCNARTRRDQARHFLLLVHANRIADNEAMGTIAAAIDEAGVDFNRAEIEEFSGVPF